MAGSSPRMRHRLALLLPILAALALGTAPVAQAQTPSRSPSEATTGATAPVARLNDALLDLMRRGGQEPNGARLQRFLPVMRDVFDLDAALQIAAAPYFEQAGEAERRQALDAFTRRSAAQYLDRFDSYNGESFTIDGERAGPRGTTLVDTTLSRPRKPPVRLTYVLRPAGKDWAGKDGAGKDWRILDVLAKGMVSQLAAQRSEFQAPLRNEGLAGLTRDLNANADRLLGGA
ncbi:ABC transporter substrate-binding protein [Azospirillum rugosum]|uniref:Phospholipid transport system substrate-binding protein n=1 Tax=Azospirillum rugosum TaxID=416170 RepID=A0ABS4STB2_9PROT|nr:ABC transporter substrate-binding protein [Azospirillum rugosum]MBP2295800.1 phospholipid transport system substrate-binding protein [Azospirillum rugosum]MDQ0529089.1 phospholipid transport system substrate-binding protein [Azospirillum rugosum]